MIATGVMMIPITSWELISGNPITKVIRKKTTYLPMGGKNTNRSSSIFKPRKNIGIFMIMTRTITC